MRLDVAIARRLKAHLPSLVSDQSTAQCAVRRLILYHDNWLTVHYRARIFLGRAWARTNPPTRERYPRKLSRKVRNSGGSGKSCGWVENSGPVTIRQQWIQRVGVLHDGGGVGRAGGGWIRRICPVVETGRRWSEDVGVAFKFREKRKQANKRESCCCESIFIKSNIDESLNSDSMPQKHSLEGPSKKITFVMHLLLGACASRMTKS